MDVHVPLAITEALRLRGADALTAQQDGARQLRDDELLDRASALGRVLFTRDADLLAEATRRQREAQEATAYNGLVTAWPELTRLASQAAPAGPGQVKLFEQG